MPDVISQSNKETISKSQSKNARSGSSGRRSSTNGESNTDAAVTATPKPGEAIEAENMSGIRCIYIIAQRFVCSNGFVWGFKAELNPLNRKVGLIS